MSKLEALAARLRDTAANPPKLVVTGARVPVRRAQRPATDSRGRTRLRLGIGPQGLAQARSRAAADATADAKRAVLAQAQEALRP